MRNKLLLAFGVLLFLLVLAVKCGRDNCPEDYVWVMSDTRWICIEKGLK